MKKIIFIIILTTIIKGFGQDVFSPKFIKEKIAESNHRPCIIKARYTPEFKKIMREMMSLSWFEKAVSMTDYYFPLFDKKIERYKVPGDLKYIAVIESGLRPKITSKAGATGLFQFMESTGKMYGLRKNKYINLFHDVVANTDCAMRYFKELHRMYGDWKFALCSYNYGHGNVNRTISKARTKDFNEVYKYFPKETKAYIKRFLVVKYLVENKDIYFPKRKRFKYVFTDLKTIRIKKPTTIKKLANQYQINENLIRFANPQLKTNYVPKGCVVYL